MKEYNPYESLRIHLCHNDRPILMTKYTPKAHNYVKFIIKSKMFTYEKGYTVVIVDGIKVLVELAPEEFMHMEY